MKPLAEKAIEATRDGRVRFHPERWTDVYLHWLENVRDWCVSRQIWWGHRLPVWHCRACGHILVSREDPSGCSRCASADIVQEEDVLDTWFSSALWPFSTLGWPEDTGMLRRYYPTDVLVTDRGIIYFWVARMVMMGLEMMGKPPFSDVYIHGTILDENGAKMSKSAGNGIDPIVMIDGGKQPYLGKEYESPGYGADAVRLSLSFLSTEGQDVRLSPTRFELGRNFISKVWNAARFASMHLGEKPPAALVSPLPSDAPLEDHWILSRLDRTIVAVTGELDHFRFHAAATALYDFAWRDFCDWYVEASKPRLKAGGPPADDVRAVLSTILDRMLRLMHPFAPFVTEEIASLLGLSGKPGRPDCLIRAPWPVRIEAWRDEAAEREMEIVQGVVVEIRRLRTESKVPPMARVAASVAGGAAPDRAILEKNRALLHDRAGLSECDIAGGEEGAFSISLRQSADDAAAARSRHEKRLSELAAVIAGIETRLADPSFSAKAPKAVVDRERARLAKFVEEKAAVEKALKGA